MCSFNKVGKLFLSIALTSASWTAFSQVVLPPVNQQHPQRKASEIFREKSQDLRDYDLNWSEVPLVDSQAFLPEMACDLSKKYFELSARPGFKVPAPVDHFAFPPREGDGYGPNGIMPWPGILGHWQDWNTGVYLQIERVQEHDLDGKVTDYMVLRIHSMCTDELLTESATVMQNNTLNQQLKIPTASYGLRLNASQMTLKVNHFDSLPQNDELQLEFHSVDSFTKEPKRSMIRVFRFL
jgi:hypothetical protein